jgi:Tfp pilus assembly protein PilN
MRKSTKTKVKPFKPLGNRVATASLADKKTAKNRPATDAEILEIVKLDKMLQDLKQRKDMQAAQWRQDKQVRMFQNEVRRADLS